MKKQDKVKAKEIGIDRVNRCDNIFKSSEKQPYLDSTVGGKWGRGKDDMCADENAHTDINNPLPY